MGFPGSSEIKNLPGNAGNAGLAPGSGRSPGEGNGNPLQYSCLENSMDRGAWWATVHGVTRVRHNVVTKPPPMIYYHCALCITGHVHCRISSSISGVCPLNSPQLRQSKTSLVIFDSTFSYWLSLLLSFLSPVLLPSKLLVCRALLSGESSFSKKSLWFVYCKGDPKAHQTASCDFCFLFLN